MKYDLPDELTVEADGPVRTVLINRAAELNCVNLNLHWALANVWRQLAADKEAKVVVLTGAGRAFCAGGDLDWITTFLDDPVARDESIREGAQIIEEMLRFPLPIMRTREYLYTGDRIPAATAVELGLASRVVAPDDLSTEARTLADRLAAQPAAALQGTKRIVNMYLSQVLGGPMQAGFAAEVGTMQTDEHRQKLLAFQQKSRSR